MKIKIDFFTKNKEGKNAGLLIGHLVLTEDDIIELAKQKILENPPNHLDADHRELESINIDEVII